jgi:hypothetical protein
MWTKEDELGNLDLEMLGVQVEIENLDHLQTCVTFPLCNEAGY